MKFKKLMLISLMLMILTIGAVSASEDLQDNLTFVDENIPDEPIFDENATNSDEGNLDPIIADDSNNQKGEALLGSGIEEEDIEIHANTKAIDVSNGNEVFATIKVPKGAKGEVDISVDGIAGLDIKLSKLPEKKTKNGVTTYTIRLKDFEDYNDNIVNDLKTKGNCNIAVFCYNKNAENTVVAENYIAKFNRNAKTLKLKRLIHTLVWAGNYDRKSGTNKKLTIHLGLYPSEKPVAGKKVKITINGVVYVKKTNSKGLIHIYPPKYLPPKEFTKVKMEFFGDDKYSECMTINDIQIYKSPGSSKSKIKASSKTFSINKTKKYTVKLLSKGKAVKKAKIKLTINGKKYSAKTNSKGKATFNLSKLNKKGKFGGTIVYMGDKKHYMSYKNVKLTVN